MDDSQTDTLPSGNPAAASNGAPREPHAQALDALAPPVGPAMPSFRGPGELPFVQPSSYLRPGFTTRTQHPAVPPPMSPIDEEQMQGLVSLSLPENAPLQQIDESPLSYLFLSCAGEAADAPGAISLFHV